jgi:hypothetical protein
LRLPNDHLITQIVVLQNISGMSCTRQVHRLSSPTATCICRPRASHSSTNLKPTHAPLPKLRLPYRNKQTNKQTHLERFAASTSTRTRVRESYTSSSSSSLPQSSTGTCPLRCNVIVKEKRQVSGCDRYYEVEITDRCCCSP